MRTRAEQGALQRRATAAFRTPLSITDEVLQPRGLVCYTTNTKRGYGPTAAVRGFPGPGWAVGAGIVAAVGIGDSVYQGFHEHWSEDIHDHGVIAGVGTGIWNSGARVGDDIGAMGREVGHMASSAWHGTENMANSVWHGTFG